MNTARFDPQTIYENRSNLTSIFYALEFVASLIIIY